MGELTQFPLRFQPNDFWQFYDLWAPDGYWENCSTCGRGECHRAGKFYVACANHTRNPKPPAPYCYTPKEDP